MDPLTDSGLSIDFDEEAGVFHLDWNPETHPQWNFLEGLTSEEFCKILINHIENFEPPNNDAEIHSGGSSS